VENLRGEPTIITSESFQDDTSREGVKLQAPSSSDQRDLVFIQNAHRRGGSREKGDVFEKVKPI
jgi:hypothetical protein